MQTPDPEENCCRDCAVFADDAELSDVMLCKECERARLIRQTDRYLKTHWYSDEWQRFYNKSKLLADE